MTLNSVYTKNLTRSNDPQLRLHKKSDTLALLMTIRKQTFVLVYEGGHP